jgi:hypothetical protein
MVRIKRWVVGKRKKVVWSEPQLPPFVKINPESPPGMGEGQQPGDLTMGAVMEEFLQMDEGEGEPVLVHLGPNGLDRGSEVLGRIGVGQPQESFAPGTEGGPGQGGNPGILE